MIKTVKRLIWLLFLFCICGAGAVHLLDPEFAGHAFRGSVANEMLFKEGEKLYVQHNCQSCHGEKGAAPIFSNYPKLIGQNQDYLYSQMVQIRDGIRKNGGSSYMKEATQNVTDNEFLAISHYLAQSE